MTGGFSRRGFSARGLLSLMPSLLPSLMAMTLAVRLAGWRARFLARSVAPLVAVCALSALSACSLFPQQAPAPIVEHSFQPPPSEGEAADAEEPSSAVRRSRARVGSEGAAPGEAEAPRRQAEARRAARPAARRGTGAAATAADHLDAHPPARPASRPARQRSAASRRQGDRPRGRHVRRHGRQAEAHDGQPRGLSRRRRSQGHLSVDRLPFHAGVEERADHARPAAAGRHRQGEARSDAQAAAGQGRAAERRATGRFDGPREKRRAAWAAWWTC